MGLSLTELPRSLMGCHRGPFFVFSAVEVL